VFENRMLRRIFVPKRDKVMGGWRKLHNEELHNLYSSPSIIRMIQVKEDEMGGACSTNGGEQECTQDIGGKAKGRRSMGRPRRRWLDNIKLDRMGWYRLD
jgi:hypothetical protein